MNKAAVFHQPDSRYCFAIDDKKLVIRLRLAKEDRDASVSLIYGQKYQFHKSRTELSLPYRGSDGLHAYFEATLELEDTRLAYIFKICLGDESYYFSESGMSEDYDFENAYQTYFQMPFVNPADVHRLVDWSGRGTFYQIFVDRFARGDFEKDDSYVNMDWTDKPKSHDFAGGDLKGIEKKLDYLQDLGITALYLTPIFKSVSNHKYDIKDYYAIDEQFGNAFSLKALVEEAHSRGIRVILDAVFNHSSNLLPEFQDVLKKGRASNYYDWFMIDGDYPELLPLNYETFASVTNMPKWNTSNPEVQAYLLDIVRFWMIEADIDGWRLDVSDEVSHDFWRQFRKVVKTINPKAIIIGENWHDAYPFLQGDQFDSIMNYAFSTATHRFFTQQDKRAEHLVEDLTNILMRNTQQVDRMNLNLLDSHDTHRFINQLDGDQDKLLSALALLLTFDGSPCIYYGTEIALEGAYDPDCRRGMLWEKADADNPFWLKVRSLLHLRKNEKALQEGDIQLLARDGRFELIRTFEDKVIHLYINSSQEDFPCPQGKMLLSHLLQDGMLKPEGFVIIESCKKHHVLTKERS